MRLCVLIRKMRISISFPVRFRMKLRRIYIPTSLRHTIVFTVKNDRNTTVLSHTSYVSDLADREILMTYVPATQADQDTLGTFDTIYDVVPLSLVAVKP